MLTSGRVSSVSSPDGAVGPVPKLASAETGAHRAAGEPRARPRLARGSEQPSLRQAPREVPPLPGLPPVAITTSGRLAQVSAPSENARGPRFRARTMAWFAEGEELEEITRAAASPAGGAAEVPPVSGAPRGLYALVALAAIACAAVWWIVL